uniref:Uncharacterized protein n=1 Tax=Timema bartmani TaxID=61472 RepID=A0A7R9EU30_9NEOP|nr:unnamed protein product [Timema bartmani]
MNTLLICWTRSPFYGHASPPTGYAGTPAVHARPHAGHAGPLAKHFSPLIGYVDLFDEHASLLDEHAGPLTVNAGPLAGHVDPLSGHAEEWKTIFGKNTFSTPDRDSNLDLPVISSPVYRESSALDHVATETDVGTIIANVLRPFGRLKLAAMRSWGLTFCCLALFCSAQVYSDCPEKCTCYGFAITFVDCVKAGLESIPQNLNTNLYAIEISYNNISSIPPNAFSKYEDIEMDTFLGLENLSSLSMDSNLLKIIKRNTFSKLVNLTTLSLINNTIEEIETDAFIGLWKLQNLLISSNHLSRLDEGCFDHLKGLSILDLSNNKIHVVGPNDFKFLVNLTTLSLSTNRIRCVHPDSFVTNTKLTTLSLDANSHIVLPTNESLINSDSLETLYLSKCNIRKLPSRIFQNTSKLDTISLHNNLLETFDKSTFSHLNNLNHLDFYNNPFTCDCILGNAWKWANERKITISARCSNPPEYSGMSWKILNQTSCNSVPTVKEKEVGVIVTCRNYKYDYILDPDEPDTTLIPPESPEPQNVPPSEQNSHWQPCPSQEPLKQMVEPVGGICSSILYVLVLECVLFIVLTGVVVYIFYKRPISHLDAMASRLTALLAFVVSATLTVYSYSNAATSAVSRHLDWHLCRLTAMPGLLRVDKLVLPDIMTSSRRMLPRRGDLRD